MNRFQFTQELTQRIGDAGFLDGLNVELINGELIQMPDQGPLHSTRTSAIADLMRRIYPNAYVREDKPIDINQTTMPEPDVAVFKGKLDDYTEYHPKASDALLIIEIAVTSLADDTEKAALYARGSAPYYWIIDIKNRRLVEYTDPEPEQSAYRNKWTYEARDSIEFPYIEHSCIVSDLLPAQ